MKTPLIINANLGQVHAYITKTLLSMAARRTKLEIIDNPNDTEMTIVLDDFIPNDSALSGKNTWLGDISRTVAHPELFLNEAKGHVKSYTAPVAATVSVTAGGPKCVVAATVCPTSVAHTFMATEAIETEAKKRGRWVKTETRGSADADNAITPEEVIAAGPVVVTADIEVDLAKPAGKSMYCTSTSLALKKTVQELDKAVTEATLYEPAGKTQAAVTGGKKESAGAYRHLLTGVSYMLLMVIVGGLCIVLSSVFGIEAFKEPDTLAAALIQIGGGPAFALMVPVLAGYTAFSIADRPSLTPGLTGDVPAVSTGPGFIGGIIAGLLAGHIAKLISTQLKLSQSMEASKPVLIVPLISSLVVSLVAIYLIGKPAAGILDGLAHWLQIMGTANAVLLGATPGGMMCTDMGGPVNKAAYTFDVGLLNTQTYGPMAATVATGVVPPLAMSLAAMVARRKFDKTQQEGGKAALIFGLCFILEGAIPSAARDPMHMLSCRIVSGTLVGATSTTIGARLMAPHGGLFVLLVPGTITLMLGYLVVTIAGMLMAGLTYAFLKRPET